MPLETSLISVKIRIPYGLVYIFAKPTSSDFNIKSLLSSSSFLCRLCICLFFSSYFIEIHRVDDASLLDWLAELYTQVPDIRYHTKSMPVRHEIRCTPSAINVRQIHLLKNTFRKVQWFKFVLFNYETAKCFKTHKYIALQAEPVYWLLSFLYLKAMLAEFLTSNTWTMSYLAKL